MVDSHTAPSGALDPPLGTGAVAAAVVDVRGLVKRFGDKVAVAGVDLAVPAGSFYGLVGPNGAGKTTLIRMVVGLSRPDEGNVAVNGSWVWPDPVPVKEIIGVLPDDLRLFERLTGEELLTYIGVLRGIDRGTVDQRCDDLLRTLGLNDARATLVADYSTGMRKKVALAAALLHVPKVLFLDEPFESVDPLSARTIVDVLQGFRRHGGTVVFSSHVMDTVERLCDHVAIISAGRIARAGTIDHVRAGERLEDAFVAAVGEPLVGTSGLEWLDG
jgi:ABC-2 type transport system ATP-binding protein